MIRDKPLHNFFFQYDRESFFNDLDCYATPWIDTCVILHLARHHRPARFLEIGTHLGHTTRVVAQRFPDMEIVTVDPGDRIPEDNRPPNQSGEYLPQERIGELVREFANVEIIKRPFLDIEWGDAEFAMIFIDGNHDLPHVLQDSHRALQLVTNPGVILWHDYNNVKDVNIALEQLNVAGDIVTLHNTWIAYLDTH